MGAGGGAGYSNLPDLGSNSNSNASSTAQSNANPNSAAASSITTPLNTTTTPLQSFVNTVATNPAGESASNLLVSVPNLLTTLGPDDKNMAINSLLQSSLIAQLLGSQDQETMQKVLSSILTSLFDSGSLYKMFNQDVPQSADIQNSISNALSENIADTINNAASKTTNQSSNNATNESLTMEIPPQAADAPPETANQVASLLGKSVAQSLTDFFAKNLSLPAGLATGGEQAAAGTGLPTQNPMMQAGMTGVMQQIQDLMANLFSTGIANSGTLPTTIVFPQAMNPELLQQNFPQFKQQLLDTFAEITQSLNNVVAQAQDDLPRDSKAQGFIVAMQQITTLASQLQPNQQGMQLFNMLNTIALNSKIMENAILHQLFDKLQEKAEFLKNFLGTTTVAAGAGAAAMAVAANATPEMKMQVLNQMLMAFPNLLNLPSIRELLGEISGGIKSHGTSKLLAYQKLLLNAAREIKTINQGRVTDEYTLVGNFHPVLESLADKIAMSKLPIRPEDLPLELLESLTHDITFDLETIKIDNSGIFFDILSKHPRVVLFLAYLDSHLLDGYKLPGMTKSLLEADRADLDKHLERILNVVHKYERSVEFLKFQPRVLELMIHEAKYDPTLDVTRHSLKVVNKAIVDYSSFIDLEGP